MPAKKKRAEDTFTSYVLDQLRRLDGVEARSMFGGKGLYWKDLIFGLIDDGRVYFRVTDETVGRYTALGSVPFEPWPGHVMKGYYEVPAGVLEDEDEAADWARLAWSQPRRKAAKKAAATRRPRSRGRAR